MDSVRNTYYAECSIYTRALPTALQRICHSEHHIELQQYNPSIFLAVTF